MANMLRKDLVDAYMTAKGLGKQAAALLVYTKQPFRLSSICMYRYTETDKSSKHVSMVARRYESATFAKCWL